LKPAKPSPISAPAPAISRGVFAHHAGKVYAVDIDAKLLAIARDQAPANLETCWPRRTTRSCRPFHRYDVLLRRAASHRKPPGVLCEAGHGPEEGGRIVVIDFYRGSAGGTHAGHEAFRRARSSPSFNRQIRRVPSAGDTAYQYYFVLRETVGAPSATKEEEQSYAENV